MALSIVASNTSGASSISVPGEVQAGDLLILMDFAEQKGADPQRVTPSGFTMWLAYGGSVDSNDYKTSLVLSYKVALGTEGGSNLTGMNGGDGNDKVLIVIRESTGPITGVSAVDSGGENTNGNPSAINIPAGSGIAPIVVCGCYCCANGTVNTRTMNPAKDGELEGAGSNNAWLAWKFYDSSPGNVSIDMDDEGDLNTLAGGYLQLEIPAAGIAAKMMHYRRLRV